ncbi:DNA primase large subunit Spp2 [Didymosphaeria variabile]|uniref:Pre-mRNA-splicing factor n=1 Tax=Didymosphaeria variabile TaxID=1932322 RepID=A0A9W9C4H9_9PLEO|nr:DNA primase large subunit Spp2 [Didymosphaeria variabile]KAJ4344743.1 DNA primase large subunit Spp2 [Didymosphaeria variabile]
MATGGFKLSLAGAKGKSGFKASPVQPQKRRRLALDDDEPEITNAKEAITGWDAAEGGAVDANKKEQPKGPRVIPALPNRDWREAAQKRQHARTSAPPTETGHGDNMAQLEQPKMAFGLTTFDKKDTPDGEEQPEPMDVDGDVKPEDSRTEEEKLQAEAFEALVNGKSTDQTVIPISEEEAFENDMLEAPDAPDLAAYEATPIEGFGAALLRGMGWKDGESLSKDKKPVEKPKEIKRRPALLGIGAKPEAAVGVELGEWGKPKKFGKKDAIKYNPVTLRNKHTGEMITEEELKERLAKQKDADAKAAKNSTFVGDDDEEAERRHEKRRERKERERRHDDYGSERRTDKSRRDDKRKERDDEYSDRDRDRRREKKYSEYEDSDRDRRRDKKYREDDYDDRRREKRREKDSGRDRSRSPYDSDRREKRRERDRRERSVDSKDRREKRRERERSRSRDSEDRRRKRREYAYDEKDDGRSKTKDDKYSRR